MVRVACPFASHGCNAKPQRKDLDKHNVEAATVHAQITSAALATLKAKCDEERRQRLALEASVASLKLTVNRLDTRHTSLEASQHHGKVQVTWKVSGLTKDWKLSTRQKSSGHFSVGGILVGDAAVHLNLQMEFTDTHIGLYICHNTSHGGSRWTPVRIGGSTLRIQHPTTLKQKSSSFLAGATITDSGKGLGWITFCSYDDLYRNYVNAADDTVTVVADVRLARGNSIIINDA
jgi:hypothetical protein